MDKPNKAKADRVADRIAAILPNLAVRIVQLRILADSIDYLHERNESLWLTHLLPDRLRLLAGRLIILTLQGDRVWLAADPTAQLSHLSSWDWDTVSYPQYKRVPSRNGCYLPLMDPGGDWPAIQKAHFAFLDRVVLSLRKVDTRSTARHEPGIAAYLSAALQRPVASKNSGPTFSHDVVFPLIARLIGQAPADDSGFVDHEKIVSALLLDAEGSSIVDRASSTSSLPDRRSVASNMVAWFSQQITVERSRWPEFFDRKRRSGVWTYRPKTAVPPPMAADAELSAVEGDPRLFFHLRRERDPALARAKREAVQAAKGRLECEACGFATKVTFPDLGGEVCEIHHRLPLGAASDAVETRLEDLAVLCANCHRAIHRTKPLLSVESFRELYFPASGALTSRARR